MIYKFTKSSERVMEISSEIAIKLGHSYIGTEHLLYGLSEEKNGIANKLLEKQEINSSIILERIEEILGKGGFIQGYSLGFTPRLKKVIENAFNESSRLDYDFIGTEHLLIGLIKEEDCMATKLLNELGLDVKLMYKELVKILNDLEKEDYSLVQDGYKENIPQNIKQFGTDLTLMAKERKTRSYYWKKH